MGPDNVYTFTEGKEAVRMLMDPIGAAAKAPEVKRTKTVQ